jgi:hypothetical protein
MARPRALIAGFGLVACFTACGGKAKMSRPISDDSPASEPIALDDLPTQFAIRLRDSLRPCCDADSIPYERDVPRGRRSSPDTCTGSPDD